LCIGKPEFDEIDAVLVLFLKKVTKTAPANSANAG
jgi:hypothetical protein